MFLMIIGFVDLLVQSYGVRAGSFLCPHLGRVGKWALLHLRILLPSLGKFINV